MKAVFFDIPAAQMSLHPILSIGLGLHWAWVFCIMFATGRILDAPITGAVGSPLAGFALAVFCSICLTFLVVGLFGVGVEPLRLRKRIVVLVTVMAIGAMVALVGVVMFGSSDVIPVVSGISGLCAGVASGYFLIVWGFAYRDLDTHSVALTVAVGLLLAVFLYSAVLWLGSPLALLIATSLIAAAEGACCYAAQKSLQDEAVLRPLARRKGKLRSCLKPAYIRVALLLVIFGFVDSILRELALSAFNTNGAPSEFVVGLILIAAGFVMLFFFVYLILEKASPEENRYSFATLFVVGLSVALLFFMDNSSGFTYRCVCVVVYLLFEVHVWTLLCRIARTRIAPLSIVYGFGLFFLFVGQFLSPIANGFVASVAKPLQLENVTEPIILMLALLTAVMLLATATRNGSPLASASSSSAHNTPHDDEVAQRVATIVQCYLLTEREGEILSMLVKGRSLAKISAFFCVSENTTKTHVKNIYRKTDVHSKQELMDLFDSV